MSGHAFTLRSKFAKEFLEAMGIDHSKVRYIHFEMGHEIITVIKVEYIMEEERMEDVANLTKKYILNVEEIIE